MAWDNFKQGKGKKIDVLKFEKNLEQNIFQLHRDLEEKKYKHRGYTDFFICDPKRRHIYKASVRDRILHHAIYQVLNPLFEPMFIATSFSCRIGKGNHKGVRVAETMIRKVSRNYTRPCYVLKCDIRKFFDSIDHSILTSLIVGKVQDLNTLCIIEEVIGSYVSQYADLFSRVGVPIGNLTSQLFANIYMNEFDQHMKRELKIQHYGRYTDDFIVVSDNKKYLTDLIQPISKFLTDNLKIGLHPDKVEILTAYKEVDFLGYVIRPHHLLMRKRTLNRIKRKIKEKFDQYSKSSITSQEFRQSFQSFLGALSHANTYKISEELKNQYWFWENKE